MSERIIVCSRYDSRRIPNKPFRISRGIPIIGHLLSNLEQSNIPITVAVPEEQGGTYKKFLSQSDFKDTTLYLGSKEDVLKRTYNAAKESGSDIIIRVTHDKVFVPYEEIVSAVRYFKENKADYLYTPWLTDGMGFEIFSFDMLEKAQKEFKEIEHLSYAIRAVASKILAFRTSSKYKRDFRLLIDYPKDFDLIEDIITSVGTSPKKVISYLDKNPEKSSINKHPLVTIYTCIHSPHLEYLKQSVESVLSQTVDFEYLIINDSGGDLQIDSPIAKVIDNPRNLGLASSSNVALSKAKGKYIVRIDDDDYFTSKHSVSKMVDYLSSTGNDVCYPSNYFGSKKLVQHPNVNHHIGGALFRTKAINAVKFTDGLRGYEGLDFWYRARKKLNVGYINDPLFFYRQHEASLTKNNLEEREQFKQSLELKHGY